VRVTRHYFCPACQYDLTGHVLPHHCPECGHLLRGTVLRPPFFSRLPGVCRAASILLLFAAGVGFLLASGSPRLEHPNPALLLVNGWSLPALGLLVICIFGSIFQRATPDEPTYINSALMTLASLACSILYQLI
jgi:hypothetical protein